MQFLCYVSVYSIITQLSQVREVKEVKEVKEVEGRMFEPWKLPWQKRKTIVINFFNFFNFLNFLELSTCETWNYNKNKDYEFIWLKDTFIA